MAPKQEQPPPVPTDLPGILEALGSCDDNERLVATLGALFTLEAGLLPRDQAGAQALVDKLQPLASHSDATVRGAAIKAVARFVCVASPVKELVLTEAVAKDAWAVLTDLASVWRSYQAAVAQIMASGGFPKPDSALGGKKPPPPAKGGAAATLTLDPEAMLPGPSKQTLDAALRVLCVLATTTQEGGGGNLLGWLAAGPDAPGLQPLVHLLSHYAPRVQYRAAQLVCVLAAKGEGFNRNLVTAGAAEGLLQLAASCGSGSIRIVAVQALQALLQVLSAAHTQLLEGGAVAVLATLASGSTATAEGSVGDAGAAVPVATRPTTAEKGGKGATAPANGPVPGQMDFTRPFPSKQADLQTAAMKVLITLTHFSQEATEQLVVGGGLQLLLAMLPVPAAPIAAASATTATPGSEIPEPNPGSAADGQDEQPTIIPSYEAQVLALRLVTQALSIPGLQAALHDKLLQDAKLAAQAAVQEAAEAAAATDAAGTPVVAPVPHVLDQLLGFFAGVPPAPAATPEPMGKNGKPEPKKPPAKGKAEDAGPAPPSPHTLPPFPATVRGVALEALAQLARHSPTANYMSTQPQVQRIISEAGRSQVVPATSTDTSTQPTTPATSNGGGPAQQAEAEMEAELAHGLALITEAMTACVGTQETAEESMPTCQVTKADLLSACKKLASVAVQPEQDYMIRTAVNSVVLALPETSFVALPRPPLPSPPPTPAPQPLATSVFLWDALDRPMMADGRAKLEFL